MAKKANSNTAVIKCLSKIFQSEMAGIMRYMHYSFMIMGHNRIPIQKWLRDQATEAMGHAVIIGEKITSLGGHPPVASSHVEESNVHSVDQILKESLVFEEHGVGLYKKLVALSQEDIALEELARGFVKTEVEHVEEVRKMIRKD